MPHQSPPVSAAVGKLALKYSSGPFVISPNGAYAYVTFNDEPGSGNNASGVQGHQHCPAQGGPHDLHSGRAAECPRSSPDGADLFVSRLCWLDRVLPAVPRRREHAYLDRIVETIDIGSGAWNVTVSPDGRFAYVWSTTGLKTVDLASGRIVASFPSQLVPQSVIISPNGTTMYIVTGASSAGQSLVIFSLAKERSVATIHVPPKATAVYVALSRNGETAYESFIADFLRVLNPNSGKTEATIPQKEGIYGLALSPDGRFLYTAENGSGVGVIDTLTKKIVGQITVANPASLLLSLGQLVISPDGRYLFADGYF